MALIETLTINVAAALAKAVVKLWLKDEGPVAIGEGVIETLKKRFEAFPVARSAERLVHDIEDDIGARLERFVRIEFPNLADNEREAAALAVADALGRLEMEATLMRTDLDATLLERAVHKTAPDPFRHLGTQTQALGERLLRECCNYIVTIAPKLPQFDAAATRELLVRSTSILQELQSVLDQLVAIRRQPSDRTDQEAAEFEDQYRIDLARVLDRVELFGVRLTGAAMREYGLTRAYVPLTVVRGDPGEPCRVEDGLTGATRIVLRGEAGFGKTFVMQWLAVQAARRTFTGALEHWNSRIPFYLKLRDFRDSSRSLPTPGDFLSGPLVNLRDLMPKGWANRALADRGLLLVDGVDELPARRRLQLLDWLRGLQELHPEAVFVVSSRPAALDSGVDSEVSLGERLGKAGYEPLTLEPMTPDDSEALVVRWHDEVASGLADPVVLEQLAENGRSLRQAVRERPTIRNLASSPLLCSMMCILNWDQKANLPDDRMELYRIALELLLERRESDREIGATYVDGLDRASKQTLLDGIAYWMLRNGMSEAERSEAEVEIGRMLPWLAHLPREPNRITQELVERSGVLREPQHGLVDFMHRTFLEYMGARAALAQGDRDFLVTQASQESWRDVVVFAAGHAQGQVRDDLIERLLRRDRFRFRRSVEAEVTAVCCLETAGRNLRPDLLQRLRELAKSLFPPRDFSRARVLSAAAAYNPELLEGHAGAQPEIIAACIRTASIVGTPRMQQVIAGYASVPGELIDQEITRAYQIFDDQAFEERVLADRKEMFGVNTSQLNPKSAECFKLLLRYKRATHTSDQFRTAFDAFERRNALDLAEFTIGVSEEDEDDGRYFERRAAGHNLTSPTGNRTRSREVERIARLTSLKSLRLASVDPDAIGNVGALKLEDLGITLGEAADLGPIADMQGLASLSLMGDGIVRLNSLRRCHSLERLSISMAKFYNELDCVGPNSSLRELSLSHVPISDFASIALAHGLKRLTLTSVPIASYAQLGTLKGLQVLCLEYLKLDEGFPWPAMQSLTDLRLSSPPPSLLLGLSDLPALNTLVARDPPVETISWMPSSVTALEIWRSGNAVDLSGIARLRELRKFNSSRCVVRGAEELTELPMLKEAVFYASGGDYPGVIPALKAKGVDIQEWGDPY